MENSNKYNRSFLIFSQEDVGFGVGREPTGHIKIEVKESQGKLYSQIHNLNINLKNIIYKLYLVRCEKSELAFLKVGSFDIKGIKTEICWNFNPKNVGMTGIGIDSFNVFVVTAVDADGVKTPEFPLVAYRGNKTSWKERLVKAICEPKNDRIIEKELQQDESKKLLANGREYHHNLQEVLENQNYPKQQDNFKQENYKDSKQYQENYSNNESEEYQVNDNNNESQKYKENEGSNQFQANESHNESQEYKANESHNELNEDQEANESRACFNIKDHLEQPIKHNCSTCFADCCARSYTPVNDDEINYASQLNNDEHIEFDKLKDILAKFYENIYPFGRGNKYYQWWRVKNPSTLNNIFHQCNIKNPAFYNPKLLMAYYKYRHLILGIYNDNSTSKEYIVIGIPGIYGLDDMPMRNFSRWAQTEGGFTRYGAFGYWLLYIDTKVGKIIY